MTRTGIAVIALTLSGPGVASAQEPGSVGISMGFPTSVGIIWHIADWLAVKPDFSIARASADAVSTSRGAESQSNTTWQTSVGLSGLFYVGRWEALRAYVSPRFAYSRATSESTVSGTTSLSGGSLGGFTSSSVSGSSSFSTSASTTTYQTSGVFGAQYSLATRLGMFGEVGLTYATASTTTVTTTSPPVLVLPGIPGLPALPPALVRSELRSDTDTIATRSSVGVIFYF